MATTKSKISNSGVGGGLRSRPRRIGGSRCIAYFSQKTILNSLHLLVSSPGISFSITDIGVDYHVDEKTVQVQLLKFREFLKEKLPKKMWTDLQPDLGVFAQVQKAELERRVEEIVQDCIDHFFEVFQKSLLLPPSTHGSSEEPKGSVTQPLQAPLDQPVLEPPAPIRTNFVLPDGPSGASESTIENNSPSQNTATDELTDRSLFQGTLHNIPADVHGNPQSHTLPSGFISAHQNYGMATYYYEPQHEPPPPLSFTPIPDHNLLSSQDSMEMGFSEILSSIGLINTNQFGWDINCPSR
jgi:hypothetical protein